MLRQLFCEILDIILGIAEQFLTENILGEDFISANLQIFDY